MRKFIISDIHGDGNVYNSIMGYLDNINKEEEIELYINGDLIDRGSESAEILIDIINRIKENKYKIIYLGGNHELMMHEVFEKRKKGKKAKRSDWFYNGGKITDEGLNNIIKDKEKILEIADFISNLKIYHKFEEKYDEKNIVLVHARCPLKVKDKCDLRIKDNNFQTFLYVWTRKEEQLIPFISRIGNKNYFTIIGHTPNNNKYGFTYYTKEKYINIDGGSARYVRGLFQYNHVPLVEVKEDYLKILTFNHNNEIIYGNYLIKGKTIPFSKEELDKEKKYLNKNTKIKKLIKLENGIIGYKE